MSPKKLYTQEALIRVQNRSIQRELICLKLWPEARGKNDPKDKSEAGKPGRPSSLMKKPSSPSKSARGSKIAMGAKLPFLKHNSFGTNVVKSPYDRSFTVGASERPLLEEREDEQKARLDQMENKIVNIEGRLGSIEQSNARIERLLLSLDGRLLAWRGGRHTRIR